LDFDSSITTGHAVVVDTSVGAAPIDGATRRADGGPDSSTLSGTPARVASDDGADGGPSGSAANGTADDAGPVTGCPVGAGRAVRSGLGKDWHRQGE